MRLKFCVACGCADKDKLEHHHLVPRASGGSDDESNLITLCHVCHGWMHGYERVNVRALTKAGLARAKARGVRLGNPRGILPIPPDKVKQGRKAGAAANRDKADIWLDAHKDILRDLQGDGMSHRAIAAALTAKGIQTPRNGQCWGPGQVGRVLRRLDERDALDAIM